MSAPTASRPPRWAQGPVVETRDALAARDERTVRVLGAALGIVATLALYWLAWSLL